MNEKLPFEHNYLRKECYKYLGMIGKGGFGKVWKVEHLYSSKLYAMKEMSKVVYVNGYVES